MTKKLFYEDPYKKECKCKVVSLMGPEVKLDQTILFIFSGGQETDSGIIDGIKVKEAFFDPNNEMVYVLEEIPEFKEGDKVNMKIDWDKRYKIMKLHSAAHIIHYLFEEEMGSKESIGSNVSERKARLDYKCEENIREVLEKIQKKANKLLNKNLEIKTYPDEENPEKRWWELEEKDWKMPCGGLHIKNTKEIGKLKLKRNNPGAGKERIEIYLK